MIGSGKAFQFYQYLAVSHFTRVAALEVLFGDYREEEANVAYSVCRSVMEVSVAIP